MKLNFPERLVAAVVALTGCQDKAQMPPSSIASESEHTASTDTAVQPVQQGIGNIRVSARARCMEITQQKRQNFLNIQRNFGFYTQSMADSAYNAFQDCLAENGTPGDSHDVRDPTTQDRTIP